MACPTCDHTMHSIGAESGRPVFWCPRCGTIKGQGQGFADAPKLVERCRKFAAGHPIGMAKISANLWHSLGIAEAITPPPVPS